MKVAVTGATGFVGSHAAVALARAGHELRVLARRPERVAPAFAPHGVAVPEVVEGDVTDPATIDALLRGCDAVVHAASVFSLDTRMVPAIRRTNVAGSRLVLATAARLRLDPIVYISSVGALLPSSDAVLTPETPIGAGVDPYTVSKAQSEQVAREMQALGAPVVSILPPGIAGPHDPHVSELNAAIVNSLSGRLMLLPRHGAFGLCDVRDVAAIVVAAMQPGRGARRYLVGDQFLLATEFARLLNRVTGRRLPVVPVPDRAALAAAVGVDQLQRVVPFRMPFSSHATRELLTLRPVDDAHTRADLGVSPRPVEETLADSVRWLHAAGHISRRQAGRLAG